MNDAAHHLSNRSWLDTLYTYIDAVGTPLMAVSIFAFVLFTHVHFPVSHTRGDAIWALPIAFSLVNEGNLDLTEYQAIIDTSPYQRYSVQYINGTPYNLFPLGVSLVALPFVIVYKWATAQLIPIDLTWVEHTTLMNGLDEFIASFVVAGITVLVYLTALRSLTNTSALLIALIFAFGTGALSTASRGLWQHGPSMLMLATALYAALRAPGNRNWWILGGFALALAYICRPTNALAVIAFTLYLLLRDRPALIRFLLGALIITLPYLALSYVTFGTLIAPGYLTFNGPRFTFAALAEGSVGTLFSPNRGLFIFSPVLLFSVVGVVLKARARALTAVDGLVIVIVGLHWLLFSLYSYWQAGHSFGPRYMTDIVPYLAYLIIPVFVYLPQLPSAARTGWSFAFVAATLFSLFVHLHGATDNATQRWNDEPVDIDQHLERVWDWSDMQFLRGLDD